MQAMDEIYQVYAKTVYRYLMSLTRDSDLAEELTQETFYQAIRSIDKYDESCKISTWLCGIAKNTLLTYRRKNPQHEQLEDPAVSAMQSETESSQSVNDMLRVPSAESEALQTEDRVTVFRMLHLLEDPYKEVLYLRLFGDLSFREIGDVLGKTENWARVTFYRGKEKLRSGYTEDTRRPSV